MRLLEIDQAQGLKFTKPYIGVDEPPPPYAILSHTWGGEEDEVDFKDIANGTCKGKEGYKKIEFCKEQAIRDGLTHFWVDTCCIDKTNSAELSEAINSMFKWYANARICYAIISDVSQPTSTCGGERAQDAWISDFKASRWFTRGWTLQELLAPTFLDFFSCEGDKLGSKSSLEVHICERTQIPPAALRGRIKDFPVEQRISWQHGRSTKREEDEAYSLLGICDVSLPVIYGEGKHNAFRRLRRELPLVEIITPHSLQRLDNRMPPLSSQLTSTKGSSRYILRAPLLQDNLTSETTQVQETYDRISSYEPLETVDQLRFKRMDGTMEWLTQNETFVDWKSSSVPSSCLWLLGKLGSGKTIAMATLVQDLLLESRQNQGGLILHYFFQHPYARSFDLFTSLVKQLLDLLVERDKQCPEELLQRLHTSFGDRNRVPKQDLSDAVLVPLTSQFQMITLCIDGIEQCDHESQSKIRDGLSKISQQTHLKLLLSGRDEMRIPNFPQDNVLHIQLDPDPHLEGVQPGTDSPVLRDIETYIDAKLHELSDAEQLFGDKDLRERVKSKLIEKSGCMFLWVCLQIDALATCETPAEVIAVLDDLPSTLKETYIRSLMRKKNGRLMCKPKVLKWVAAAEKPITVDQLREMLSLDLQTGQCDGENMPSAAAVKQSTVGLLTVDRYKRLLAPIHHSVRQFLFSQSLQADLMEHNCRFDQSTLNELGLTMKAVRLDIARISLLHIESRTGLHLEKGTFLETPPIHNMINPTLRNILGLRQKTPIQVRLPLLQRHGQGSNENDFLQYAIRTWTMHTREISNQDISWANFQQVALQPNASYRVHPWTSIGGTENSHLRGLFGFAVSHNHPPLLRLLQDRPTLPPEVYDLVLPENGLLPALHVAAEAGFVEIVTMLLQFCKVNAPCPQLARTALHYGAHSGHEEIVSLLCKARGAKIDLRDSRGHSPLSLAAQNGHESILKILLRAGKVNSDMKGNDSRTALHWAALNGHEATVKVLLESGRVDAAAKDSIGWTALYWAALNGHEATVKVLLESGRVDAATKGPVWTALYIAAENGHEATVKVLLLSEKVYANVVESSRGQTALHIAAERGHVATVKALLESERVDANVKGQSGRTALHIAANKGYEGIVKALLESGRVDANAQDHAGYTALQLARGHGYEAIVNALLQS